MSLSELVEYDTTESHDAVCYNGSKQLMTERKIHGNEVQIFRYDNSLLFVGLLLHVTS